MLFIWGNNMFGSVCLFVCLSSLAEHMGLGIGTVMIHCRVMNMQAYQTERKKGETDVQPI